jgi:3-methyladenine DNA glycosylase AlkD
MALSSAETRATAQQLLADVRALPVRNTAGVRRLRRRVSAALASAAPRDVLAIALQLRDTPLRWVGYEIARWHRPTMQSLKLANVLDLGAGIASWDQVDSFGIYIAGPTWLNGQISDAAVRRWTRSPDVWWRRTALVATVVLNTKAHGGSGDAKRTLDIAEQLVDDREDMVVKGLSWALRSLAPWDAEAVRRFIAANDARLAPRVKRETRTKLATGRKNPRRAT